MAESDYVGIQARDRVEHFKSTPERPMTYVVLGFVAMHEDTDDVPTEVVKVKYVADYDTTVAYTRDIDEFNGYTQNSVGNVVKRFTVLNQNAISIEERDDLYDVLPEQNA